MTNHGDVVQVELLDDGSKVISDRVEVVSRRGPAGTAVAAAVVSTQRSPASARAGTWSSQGIAYRFKFVAHACGTGWSCQVWPDAFASGGAVAAAGRPR